MVGMAITGMDTTRLYQRQRILDLAVPDRIMVVGVGGVGYWVALLSAMVGVRELHLVDPDVLEIHNLNRIPASPDDVGRAKVDVAEDHIRRLRPDALVFTYKGFFDDALAPLVADMDYVIDATDNANAHRLVREACRRYGARYINPSYDGEKVSITTIVDEEDWDTGPDAYTIVPSYVAPPVLLASLAVHIMVRRMEPVEIPSTRLTDMIVRLSR